MKKLILGLILLFVTATSVQAAYEDFANDYNDVDENSELSASTSTITMASFNARSRYGAYYKDFTASYFGTTLQIQGKFNFSAIATDWILCYPFALSANGSPTGNDDLETRDTAGDENVGIRVMKDGSDSNNYIYLDVREDGAEVDTDKSLEISLSTDYYWNLARSGNTFTLSIYTGSQGGTLFDTLTADESAYTTSYQWCWGLSGWDNSASGSVSGTVSNLDLITTSGSSVIPIIQYNRRRRN